MQTQKVQAREKIQNQKKIIKITADMEEQTKISLISASTPAPGPPQPKGHMQMQMAQVDFSNGIGLENMTATTTAADHDRDRSPNQNDMNDIPSRPPQRNHSQNQNQNYNGHDKSRYNNNRRYNYHNQNYNNGYGYNNQRRHNNGYNNYNNFRNYGNNRRQFQQHPDFYHASNQNYHNHNQHNNNNGYYNNRGGSHGQRQYPHNNMDNFNRYHRRGNDLPDYEGNHPVPAKRGNWSNGHQNQSENYYDHDGNIIPGGPYHPYPDSQQQQQQGSPDESQTSDANINLVPGAGSPKAREIFVINGHPVTAQNLGTYEYFVESLQQGGGIGNYPYSNYPYNFCNNYAPCDNDSNADGTGTTLSSPTSPPSLILPTDSNPSSRAESCCTESPPGEKTVLWPADESADGSGSDSESVPTSIRCQSPEEDFCEELSVLTNDPGMRVYGNIAMFAKDGFSPSTAFCVRLPKRNGALQHTFPREWFEDLEPEEIIKQFNQAGEVSDTPPMGVLGPVSSSLDRSIWTKFVENQQTTETFRKKVELWRDIYRIVRYLNLTPDFKHDPRNFPAFGLQVVGSTVSGFGSNTSDVDMCLVIRDSEVDQRYEAVERLQTLSHTLHLLPFVENVELIYAKVPILKFRDANRRLDVDLNCNNFVGIRNTHLLYAYSQMDWRLKPLVLVVKLWAQFHRINDAKNMTISSYSLVLMVIHFLQCGVDEPVLPVLHKMYPEKFSNQVPILNVKIHENMPPWESCNKMGLGELFILFLEYYSRKFDYTRCAISVRAGSTIPVKAAANYKSSKNDFHQWKFLCVEEPFDRTNTARSVYDRDIFERIIGIFFSSWQRLLVSQGLDSVFSTISEEDLRAISSAVSSRLRF